MTDQTVISNKVHEFYTIVRQLPLLKSLHAALNFDIDYPVIIKYYYVEETTITTIQMEKDERQQKDDVRKSSVVTQRLKFYKNKVKCCPQHRSPLPAGKTRQSERNSNLICSYSYWSYTPSFIQIRQSMAEKSPENWVDGLTDWRTDGRRGNL